eukprot:scaffold108454_cov76-Phaeocystis_antarctica.AAC.6
MWSLRYTAVSPLYTPTHAARSARPVAHTAPTAARWVGSSDGVVMGASLCAALRARSWQSSEGASFAAVCSRCKSVCDADCAAVVTGAVEAPGGASLSLCADPGSGSRRPSFSWDMSRAAARTESRSSLSKALGLHRLCAVDSARSSSLTTLRSNASSTLCMTQ